MKLNITSQYALRIMHLISHDTGKLYNAKKISLELHIPYKYLTKIMTMLVNADLIKSTRGRNGGYKLIKSLNEIRIIEILKAVKECINESNCVLGLGKCDNGKKCALHDIWKESQKNICSTFVNTTLDMLN